MTFQVNTCFIISIVVSILVLICVITSLIRIFHKQVYLQKIKRLAKQKSRSFEPSKWAHHIMSIPMKQAKVVPQNSNNSMPHIPSPVNPYTPPSIAPIRPPTGSKAEPIDDKPLSPLSETFSESMNNEILASYDTRRRPSVVLAAELMDPGPLPTDAISVMDELWHRQERDGTIVQTPHEQDDKNGTTIVLVIPFIVPLFCIPNFYCVYVFVVIHRFQKSPTSHAIFSKTTTIHSMP